MPEFIVKTYTPDGAPRLATRCIDEAELAADQPNEPTDYRRTRK